MTDIDLIKSNLLIAVLSVLILVSLIAISGHFLGPHIDRDTRHDAQCQSWGAAYHTPEYAVCRAALESADGATF